LSSRHIFILIGLSYFFIQIHELPPEKLKVREVVMIDIANDLIQSSDYKPHEDPTKFKSQKTGRGPLVGKWQDTVSSSLILTPGLDIV
jgi:hypothetical protein